MKANCWYGPTDVRSRARPGPEDPEPARRDRPHHVDRDLRSDLHLYNGFIPTMVAGDILGHEFMGEVVEVGTAVQKLAVGDRVVVPFPIACGNCLSASASSTRSARTRTRMRGWRRSCGAISPAGIFGYSHMLGGYAGGQAEYARVPFADVGPLKIPHGCRTSRRCSSPTSCRRATWRRSSATSSPATRRGVGLRSRWPVRHEERHCSARAHDRHRPVSPSVCAWRASAARP